MVSSALAFCMLAQPVTSAVPTEAYKSYIAGLLETKAGNVEQAAIDYQRTTDMDKNAAYVYRDLAFSLWQAGKPEEAKKAAGKLKEFYGENISVLLFLGSFYLLAGESALARDCWEKAIKLDPENETAALYLAAFHASDNDPNNAVSYWNKYIDQEPNSSQAYYQMGLSQEKLGESEKARDSYQKSLSIKPDNPDAMLSMAQIYEKEEKFGAAAQEYEKYLELVPDNISVMLYLGGLYYKINNYDASESAFLRAYRINPSDTTVCFWLGIIAEEKKDWNSAIKYFEAVAKKESSPSVLLRLSYYYSSVKDFDKALNCLNKVIKLEPNNAVSYYLLGLAYFDMQKYGAAQKNFIKAKQLKPNLEGVSFHLGALYDQKGKFEQAVTEMENEIKFNPDYAPALNYLGYTYADKGMKLDEAETLVKKAVALEPDNGSYIDSLGWLYFKENKYDEAEKYLNSAAEKISDPVVFEHLGDLYAKQNRTLDAWNAYRKAQDLGLDKKTIKKKIKEMEKLVLPSTLQRKVLKRAIGNLMQVQSLKAGFTVSGNTSNINFRLAGFFQYLHPGLWRVDVLGSFLAPQVVIIQNKGLKLYPQALESSFSREKKDIFDRIEQYFNTGLLEEFDSDKTVSEQKGSKYYYKLGEKSLIIDSESGTVKEFRPGPSVIFKFKGYKLEEGLYVPVDIEVFSGSEKINAKIKLSNCTINKHMEESIFSIEPGAPASH